jgi:hypothetical protein
MSSLQLEIDRDPNTPAFEDHRGACGEEGTILCRRHDHNVSCRFSIRAEAMTLVADTPNAVLTDDLERV